MTTAHLDDGTAQAFVDGVLRERERAACDAHLAGCADCRLVVESYRALAEALDGLDAPPPPADFTVRVMARIDAIEHARATERWLAAGILVGSLVLAAILAGVAGTDTWAKVATATVTGVAAAAKTLAVVGDVASPLFRTLRLQITVACCVALVALLLSFWRLIPYARELAIRS